MNQGNNESGTKQGTLRKFHEREELPGDISLSGLSGSTDLQEERTESTPLIELDPELVFALEDSTEDLPSGEGGLPSDEAVPPELPDIPDELLETGSDSDAGFASDGGSGVVSDREESEPDGEPDFCSAPGSPCAPLPAYKDFVFESREGRFLFSGSGINILEENEPVHAYCQVVADFYGSPGPGVMMVEGNHKYAAVLGRRKLQQQGEITDEFVLHPMQNLKVGKNQSALFYQFVPRADQTRLLLESEKSPEGFLLHDTVGLLAGLLKKMKRDGPVALALHLPEAMMVVAGDRKRVIWARRYALAGEDLPALADGFEVISQDLQIARREAGMDIREVLWIESLTRALIWPEDPSEEIRFTRLPVFGLRQGEAVVYSSLPGLMGMVPQSLALSEPADRILVEVGHWEKWILAGVFSLTLMLAGAGVWMHRHVGGLEDQARQLASQKRTLRRTYSSLTASVGFTREEQARAVDASKAAARVQRVEQSVPLAAVWNGLAGLRPASCRIQALELTYENTLAKLRLEGVIDLGLTQAQAVYSSFLAALEKKGFVVKQQNFQMDMDSNFFSMVLEKPFTE